MAPNGGVEGPPRSAAQAPRAHTVFQRPRRVTTYRSRSPPMIVRRHLTPFDHLCWNLATSRAVENSPQGEIFGEVLVVMRGPSGDE